MMIRFCTLFGILFVCSTGLGIQGQERGQFPSGRECAARMTVPPGFEVKCFASEPEVVNPIGIDFDHGGRVYVIECLTYPQKLKAPRLQSGAIKDGKVPAGGRDRIRIYEDTDGDGMADKVTTFAEGLNLATGIAVGYGGVFVGQAPELLFLKDTNGDDKADEVTVLLDGWGYQDTHETLNSFIWGPDGWLYGCHGVFTHSRVGKPGTPDKDRVPLNAGIWRYHPKTQKFELFAEGTSNPWGYDYDENGSGFLTACVIPHLFHMIPGGRYIRQAGQNFNPYNYGQIREICDHVHYIGSHSHAGNKDERRFDVGGGHAHSACLVYQGGAFPEKWNGRVFMNNIHGSRINTDILKKNGSTYIGTHGDDFLVANDHNNRVIQLRTGPDGSVYMIDWYDPQICHNTDGAIWDRSHGRIYKVGYKSSGVASAPRELASAPRATDLYEFPSGVLVDHLEHKNSWVWRRALLILGERGDKSIVPLLHRMARKSTDYRHSLRALWALAYLDAFDEGFGAEMLKHKEPWVRVWAVRLLGGLERDLDQSTWKLIGELARTERNRDVILQLASSCQRWQVRQKLEAGQVIWFLWQHEDEALDGVVPLMIWFAYEPYVGTKDHGWPFEQIPTFEQTQGKHAEKDPYYRIARYDVLPRGLRKLVSTGNPDDLDSAVGFFQRIDGPRTTLAALRGLLEGLRGRRLTPPSSWQNSVTHLRHAFPGDAAIQRNVRLLGVHFGDGQAVAAMEREALDPKAGIGDRIQAAQSLALARLPGSVAPLFSLSTGDHPIELRREALRALAAFDNDKVPSSILAEWSKLPPDLRKEVVGLLSGRKAWAYALVDALKKGTVNKQDLNENDVRRLIALKDTDLTKKVEAVWGKLREQTPQKVAEQMNKLRQQLATLPGDRVAGQALFEKNCMVCHKLHGKGNEVGPDITGANRRDAEYLLTNIIDPNRVVGRDYYTAVVLDKSGRIHTGLLAEDTPQRITLKGENTKLTTIPRNEIDAFKIEERSLMPEGLPDTLTEEGFRDLIAYLLEEPFLTRGLIAGPFKMALDTKGPIETASDPLHTEGVKWKAFQVGPTGLIDMDKQKVLAPPTDSTAYVYVEINAPRSIQTVLETAADEDLKVWFNGKEIIRRMHSLEPQRVPIELKEGTNKLLLKVHNIYGASWVWARVVDPERVLDVAPLKAP